MGASRSALVVLRGASGAPKDASGTSRGRLLGAPGAPSEASWGASVVSQEGFGELLRAPRTHRKQNAETMEFLVFLRF